MLAVAVDVLSPALLAANPERAERLDEGACCAVLDSAPDRARWPGWPASARRPATARGRARGRDSPSRRRDCVAPSCAACSDPGRRSATARAAAPATPSSRGMAAAPLLAGAGALRSGELPLLLAGRRRERGHRALLGTSVSPGAERQRRTALAVGRCAKRCSSGARRPCSARCSGSSAWSPRSSASNLHALIAAVFLYLPTLLLLRRREDFAPYGLTAGPLGRGLLVFAAASLLVFPLFAVGLYGYYRVVCAAARLQYPAARQRCAPCAAASSVAGARRAGGFRPRSARWSWPSWWWWRCPRSTSSAATCRAGSRRAGPRGAACSARRWGRRCSGASALFALGHLLVDFNPLRLAVFFPALVFGWMRQATGSILAGTLFHAASNLVSELLHTVLFLTRHGGLRCRPGRCSLEPGHRASSSSSPSRRISAAAT